MEQEYVFNLKQLIEYTPKGKGDFEKTGSIIFRPPGMDVFDETSDFEQIVMGAMLSAGKASGKEVKQDDEDAIKSLSAMKVPTPDEIRLVLFANQDVKIRDIVAKFKKLAFKTAKLDETTVLKESHLNKMDRKDFIDMICGYISFFTFPSLLRGEQPEDNGSASSANS